MATATKYCTRCGQAADDLTWFPFAEYLCPSCAAEKQRQIDEEIRAGKVCSFCGKAWSLCVC